MSRYPEEFDDDSNLYLVHDALRLKLSEDYEVGDTSITIIPDGDIMDKFPATGLITLTEQCNEPDLRALSFSYSSKTDTTFDGLIKLDCFTDVSKPKLVTNVTQNVMAEHHNALKDAIIAIETFVGVKGEIAQTPLTGTMEARINFLRRLVLSPKAWFTSNKRIGIVPLCIDFKDFSTRQPDVWIWDFGDSTISIISRTDDIQTGDVTKCYISPGIFTVTETVSNEFGEDSLAIPDYIIARVEAPGLAEIEFIPTDNQILDDGVLRSRIDELITITITDDGEQPEDPIVRYIWEIEDDLQHENSITTTASFSVGGLYNIRLKTETELGSFRISSFPDSLDIVERFSIWHFIFDSSAGEDDITKDLNFYEFGLVTETYKTTTNATSVTRDYTFLTGEPEEERQIREFRRNNGFTPKSLVASGDRGSSLLFWSEGAASMAASQVIRFREFKAFEQTWSTPVINGSGSAITRRWNWVPLISADKVRFLFGNVLSSSSTNQTLTTLSLNDLSVTSAAFSNYANGADELEENVGGGIDGDFSVYRSTWQDQTGYIARNDGSGVFFRIKSFYRTEGTTSNPVQLIRKVADIPGSTKLEGQLLPLSNGIYFFNNTGEVAAYNPTTNVWTTGGPGVNSPAFTELQDTSVTGYDDPANTLVATSDMNHTAYLSYDYSVRAVLKFSELDLTFSALAPRPEGEQFSIGLY